VFSFFALTLAIYFLAKALFKKRAVAFISLALFVFNGSFAFLEFFKTHPLSANTLTKIITNTTFSSFGPYDGKVVSAFWNLNIYTNQRHLGLAYAAFLGLILIIYNAWQNPKKLTAAKAIALGLAVGLFPFIHTAVFGMMAVALVIFFFLYPTLRKKVFIVGTVAALIALPQLLYMGRSQVAFPYFDPGYLIDKLSVRSFLNYWVLNLGPTLVFVPIGFFLSGGTQRKIILPFIALFIIGNLFRFSPDIATNHKFFNLFLIGISFFSASALVALWKRGALAKILVGVAFLLMTFSGVIDLFPILNDSHTQIPDYQKNPAALFITRNTPKAATFLNSSLLYDPASLAGRKVYLGWPYFSWSAGYDTDSRFQTMKTILEAKERQAVCGLAYSQNIDYVEIQRHNFIEDVLVNHRLFSQEFKRIYYDPKEDFSIYDVRASCQ
jgi:hypothetical protein